jgi:hypothetical protein
VDFVIRIRGIQWNTAAIFNSRWAKRWKKCSRHGWTGAVRFELEPGEGHLWSQESAPA